MKYRSDSIKLAILYKSGLLIVLNTTDGSTVKTFGLNYISCSSGCALAYESTSLNVFGVVTSSGYLGLTYFDPFSGSPNLYSSNIFGYTITGIIAEPGLSGTDMFLGLSTSGNAPLLVKTTSPFSSISTVYQSVSGNNPLGLSYDPTS